MQSRGVHDGEERHVHVVLGFGEPTVAIVDRLGELEVNRARACDAVSAYLKAHVLNEVSGCLCKLCL